MQELKDLIRDVPDFPKPGIIFKDITPALANGPCFQKLTDALRDRYRERRIDVVAGIEARGFIFGASLAYALGAGLVIIRKPGKLPYKTYRETYTLEYGADAMEVHQDAIKPGQKVLLIDDVLATGGTIAAARSLIQRHFPQAEIAEAAFVIELGFLKGREKLQGLPIFPLLRY